MKKFLVLNSIKILVNFIVSYSLPKSQKIIELKSGNFVSSIFRTIDIPEDALNINVIIQTIDSKGNKKIVRQEKHDKAFNICYEVYENVSKIEVKTIACQKFIGACAIYGINKSSSIIRATIFYTIGKETKNYISGYTKKDSFFSFIVPSNAQKIQIKIEKAKDIGKKLWVNIYTESFTNKSYPTQKCYEISKPLFKDIKCTSLDCSKM